MSFLWTNDNQAPIMRPGKFPENGYTWSEKSKQCPSSCKTSILGENQTKRWMSEWMNELIGRVRWGTKYSKKIKG